MITNEEILRNVMAEIMWEPELREAHSQIGISVENGIVMLYGTVDSYRKKCTAESAAKRVSGVQVVANDLQVKIDPSVQKLDSEIGAAVSYALCWNSAIDEDKLEIFVDDGWVSLKGEVDWNFQRSIIEKCVESLKGVRGVINSITVKPKDIDLQVIQHKITAAFHRGATIDATSIKLEQVDDKIILKGTVRSLAEKKEAERIARSSPTVRSVENYIFVDAGVLI